MSDSLIYAIDFGTSNSLLSASTKGGVIPPIPLDLENKDSSIMRSLMYFPKQGAPSFGRQAVLQYVEEGAEGRFIRSIKKYLPMESFVATSINNKAYSLEDLVSRFLAEMKSRADHHFNHDCSQVVLGRPARFSQDDKLDALAEKRLQKAAQMAGFTNIHFLPEPIAAAYEYKKTLNKEQILLVVDLGGGTSDFTLVKVHQGRFHKEDVLGVGGLSLAGDHLDGCIMGEKVAQHLGSQVQYKFPMSSNILTMPPTLKFNLMSPADITLMSRGDIMSFLNEVRKCTMNELDLEKMDNLFYLIRENLGFAIFEEIEKCKQSIGGSSQVSFIFESDDIYIKEEVKKSEFEKFTKSSVDKILGKMDEIIVQAGLSSSGVDLVCCTGGTSKVGSIQDGLVERFGSDKIKSFKNFHSVSQGLSEYAASDLL